MKIALIGYGKMGKEIEMLALTKKHEIILKVNSKNAHSNSISDLSNADVAIEFSTPSSAVNNILKCFEANVPVVTGTTGWLNRLEEIKKICFSKKQSLFYASNFSIGVNIVVEINKKLAQMINKYVQYDVKIEEIHHKQKLDAPSGTAILFADDIIKLLDRKKQWINKHSGNTEDLEITSIREAEVTGTHTIKYFSDVDNIEIKHSAISRKGFSAGALSAAEWLIGKKGIFTMKDFLN